MRRTIRSVGVLFVAMLGAIGLAVGSAFSAALAFGAVALIVPGTGTHNIGTVMGYKQNAANRFIDPSGVPCSSMGGCVLDGIDYPASFFPLVIFPGWCPGLSCDTWNKSVGTGVTNLDTALTPFKATMNHEDVIVFGYSQGGAVVSQEMYKLAGLDQNVKKHITVVTIGNINNPRGLWSRLSFLPTIPILDISFNPQLPTNIGIKSTNYSFEYDPVGDAPSYWGNPLAMLNAVAAFQYVHGYYLVPNSNGTPDEVMPYGYDNASLLTAIKNPLNSQTYHDATFVLIPQQGPLPLYQPFIDLAKQTGTSWLINPLVALLNPVTKLLVNLGYDRVTNPGIPQTLSILPFNPFTFNPITFSVQFVQAIIQGIQDAINGGPSTTLAPATTTPLNSTLALRSIAPQSDVANAPELTGNPATVSDLVSKKVTTEAETTPTEVKDPVTADVAPAVTTNDPAGTTQAVTESTSTETPTTTQAVTESTSTETPTTTDATVPEKTKTAEPESTTEAATKDEPKTVEPTKDATTKVDTTKVDTTKDDATKDDVKKDDVKKDDVKKDEPKKDEPKKDAGGTGTKDAGDSAKKDAAA